MAASFVIRALLLIARSRSLCHSSAIYRISLLKMARFTSDDVLELADRLKQAKDRGHPAHFLIGAGCSISADIPSANDLIKEIHAKYPKACAKLSDAERYHYGACMALLATNERRDLIRPYLENAKINWGTIALARLIEQEFVQRVLTLNFDLVLENACGLLGLQPAVYDFGVAPASDPRKIVSPAIIHLHGQSYGLVLLNTEDETGRHQKKLQPILTDTLNGAPLVVIGYSGSADGISQNLLDGFEGNEPLYWLGYSDELASHLHGFLEKDHFYFLGGADFDRFMIELTQSLGCWPPDLFSDPLGHLLKGLKPVVPYPVGSSASAIDLLGDLRRKIETLQLKLNEEQDKKRSLRELYMRRDYAGVAKAAAMRGAVSDEDRDIAYWSFVEWGDQLAAQAENAGATEAARLYSLAEEKYGEALNVNRSGYEALYNWGTLFSDRAENANGDASVEFFAAAREKYQAALAIKPNDLDSLKGLADTLLDLAELAEAEDEAPLLSLAAETYQTALAVAPRDVEVLNALGNVLLKRAKDADDTDAAPLFASAQQKYEAALKIKADNDEVLSNIGDLLSEQAARVKGDRALELYAAAEAKYQAALDINPNNVEALNNWGNLLAERGKRADGDEASGLFAAAEQKYDRAVAIEPNNVEALYNWGNLLSVRALCAGGEEASRLAALATEKYGDAVRLKPDANDVLNNWADLLLELGKRARGKDASWLLDEAGRKLALSLKIDPNDAVVLCSFGEFLSEQARRAGGEEATRLYKAAGEKYAASLKVEPDYAEALSHWGRSLLDQARHAGGKEASRLLAAAAAKLKKAAKIDPAETYNLACLAAARGDEAQCHQNLEHAEKHGTLPDVDVLASDVALEAIRRKPWFQKLFKRQKALQRNDAKVRKRT